MPIARLSAVGTAQRKSFFAARALRFTIRLRIFTLPFAKNPCFDDFLKFFAKNKIFLIFLAIKKVLSHFRAYIMYVNM